MYLPIEAVVYDFLGSLDLSSSSQAHVFSFSNPLEFWHGVCVHVICMSSLSESLCMMLIITKQMKVLYINNYWQ